MKIMNNENPNFHKKCHTVCVCQQCQGYFNRIYAITDNCYASLNSIFLLDDINRS